jgi:hypothetical protein
MQRKNSFSQYKVLAPTISPRFEHAFITVRNMRNTEFLTAGVEQRAVRADHLEK